MRAIMGVKCSFTSKIKKKNLKKNKNLATLIL